MLQGALREWFGLGCTGCYWPGVVRTRQELAGHVILQRSQAFWIPLSVSAAVLEEIWRAACLTLLDGTAAAVATTAIACGAAHSQTRGRTLSAILYAIYSASLFLWMHTVSATIAAHVIVNVGIIYLIHLIHRRGGR